MSQCGIKIDLYSLNCYSPMNMPFHALESKLIMDKNFATMLGGFQDTKLSEPQNDSICAYDSSSYAAGKVVKIEDVDVCDLDAVAGCNVAANKDSLICAYSESSQIYDMISGRAISSAHTLVYIKDSEYVPISFVSLKYITHSKNVADRLGPGTIISDHVSRDTSISIAKDKMLLLDKYCVPNSLLFVDGPLIAGDDYTTFIKQIDRFCENNIVSVFFVSNSSSCMVVDNVESLLNQFNSDTHWANSILKPGQRTAFYSYTDQYNSRNSKAFCYIKPGNNSNIVRLELPLVIFNQFKNKIDSVLNLAYYMILVQGKMSAPQVRLISVARMYAKEILKTIDLKREIEKYRIQTMINNSGGDDL